MAKINIQAGPSTGGGAGGGNLQLLSAAAMSATLTAVTDTANTQSPLKLSTTGVQSTSKIQITTSDTNYIDAEDNSGNNRFTVGRGVGSQLVTVDFASVPTSLTTPVGAIRTATDGVNLVNVQTFLENGNIGLGTDTPGSKLDVHSTGAIVAQFNKTVSGNSYIQQLMAGTARWKQGFTTATGAFDIIDDVNALTRLSLLNTGQLKLNAYTSTSSFTGTTAGFLAFDASGNILSVTSPATSPSGVAGAIQFSNGSAFASDATNFFWDNTNKRLGVGTNAPLDTINAKGVIRASRTDDTSSHLTMGAEGGYGKIIAYNGIGVHLNETTTTVLQVLSGNVTIGNGTTGLSAKLGIKGSGSTSATTSLLVQNSAGTEVLKVTDDGNAKLGFAGTNNAKLFFEYPLIGGGIIFGDAISGSSAYGRISLDRGTGEMRIGAVANGGYFVTLYSNGLEAVRIDTNQCVGFGVTSINSSAKVQIDSTTKGFLPPRMTTTQKNAIGTPAAGLMVYDTTLNKLCVYTTAWETITSL